MYHKILIVICKARFKRRILHAPNAIQTMHNEEAYLIIYCLNCIRCMQNSTFETGLIYFNMDISLYSFKTILQNYYFAALDINYNPECPRTFKTVFKM